ncbi:hypothetical protein [Streptomyces bacillaris]|uniref:hypothetical protein n=1 Tax=Streptomyces bacillaris TaxID=68179 RepID=UPI003D7192D6
MADSFQILGYPHATVIAEKLSAAVSLGDLNIRDRDYGGLSACSTSTTSTARNSPPH